MNATPLLAVFMYATVGINIAVATGRLATVNADRRGGQQAPACRLDSFGIGQAATGIGAACAQLRVNRPSFVSTPDVIVSAVHVPNCHKNAA